MDGPFAELTHADCIERSEALVEAVAARAADTEAARRIPDETMDAVRAAGLLHAMVPRRYGGPGLGLRTVCEISRVLARGCPSTSWVVGFLVEHNWQFARFPEQCQDEILGPAGVLTASAQLQPSGRMAPAEGGYVVSGRWAFCSAALHSDWAILAGIERGEVGGERGAALVFIVPMSDVTVDDDWHTAGMRGTGSVTLVADEVFVPAHRTVGFLDFAGEANPGTRIHPEPIVGYPLGPSLAVFASSVAVGAAERTVELFREQLGSRVLFATAGDTPSSRPRSQARLADAAVALRSAQLLWADALDVLCTHGDAGTRLTVEQRAWVRLLAGKTVLAARDAIATVCDGAGASVYYERSPIQRFQRDVETMKGHVVFDTDRSTVSYGQAALGLPLTDPF
ncbi:MAG: acyl-CoA dehydrogenase family protein [Acidimicrobiia bacterium]|nr:acyl-CoA dehydrogenase family protein [Acidimicrobiia bacterium]